MFVKTIWYKFLEIYKYNYKLTRDINTKINGNLTLEGGNRLFYGSEVKDSALGYGTYIGGFSKVYNAKIGRYCSIGSYFSIAIGSHPVSKNVSTHPAFFSTEKQAGFTYVKDNKAEDHKKVQDMEWSVVIGNDVWIGANVLILEGITIGDGAVIAAGAVVTKDVAPYTIVGGVPSKLIRKRFSDDEIDYLLKLKWWDKDEAWIKCNADSFENIDLLRSKTEDVQM